MTTCRCACFASLLLIAVFLSVFPRATDAQSQSNNVADSQPTRSAYGKVLRVSILCRDVEATSKLWAELLSLHVPEVLIHEPGSSSFMDFHGAPDATYRRALLQLENTQLEFVQPLGNVGPQEAEFAKKHAAGVRRVLFALADPAAAERFQQLGLVRRTQGGRDLYLENPDSFGVVTEWVAVQDAEALDAMTKASESRGQNLPPAPSGGLRSLLQVALSANDVEAMSRRWAAIMGIPSPQVPPAQVPPAGRAPWIFHGQPSGRQLRPVFMSLGHTLIEVVGQGSGEGSNPFLEFLNKRGQGVHHFAFSVDDMAATVRHFGELGLGVGMVPGFRPNSDPSRPNTDLHMMDGFEKLGVDVELFHQVACCDQSGRTFPTGSGSFR